ncbi:MAG: PIN domain-containing protein [Acidobacteriota bacterium]|nr:PIN domain-containing protein [Acidobacteriota bacterium]
MLIDAGPLIALFDRGDAYNKAITAFLDEKKFFFVSTVAVIAEVSAMLDFSVKAQIDFYRWVMGKGLEIVAIGQNDMPRIAELCEKYADRPMDFADATLVVAAEITGIREIISIDSDFDVYRIIKKERLENLYKG